MRKATRLLLIFVIIFGGGLLAVQLFLHSSVKSIVASSNSEKKRKKTEKVQTINTNDHTKNKNLSPKSNNEELDDHHHHVDENHKNVLSSHRKNKPHNFVTANPQDPFYDDNNNENLNHNNNNNSILIVPSQEDWFPDKTEKISDESKKDRWSEPALLKNYVANRKYRACDNLPSNVSITQSDDIILGEVSITRMPKWRQEQLRGGKKISSCSYAFVLMVSNHKYVDGALVMAETIWRTSSKVKKGEICLVMLTSEKLHPDSIRQLSLVFDVVKAMRTLGTFVPKSYYAPTFDKAYLWSLTEYKHVMFLDADHYVTEADQIESLLISAGSSTNNKKKKKRNKKQSKNNSNNNTVVDSDNNNDQIEGNDIDDDDSSVPENRIVAVGDHEYFQTGLMILKPNMNIFVDLYLEFRYGTFGYNQWRARDGILIRNCFLKSNEGIGHPSGIFHFYGFFKPWFDFRKSRKITKEPIQFDGMYTRWWNVYEDLHLQLFRHMPMTSGSLYGGGRKSRKSFLRDQAKRKFHCHDHRHQGTNNDDSDEKESTFIDPDCFVWLQRHRENEEYIQPLSFVKARWWNLRVPSLKVVLSGASLMNAKHDINDVEEKKSDCSSVCKRRNLVCRDDAFQWSTLANCDALSTLMEKRAFLFDDNSNSDNHNVSANHFKCRTCSIKSDGTSLPYINLQTQECSLHSFYAQKFQPRCDAELTNGQQQQNEINSLVRICPCVKKIEQNVSSEVMV